MKRVETKRRWRSVWTAGVVAVALGLMMAASADDAAACRRNSLPGKERRCTYSEAFVQCFRDSEDAYWQCRRRNPGFVGAIKCSFANTADNVACLASSGIFAIARPFFGGDKG